ncbi:MAG: DUF4160 domain-containing protein [Spirosoma sp.]|nr:DUF4160 domain-containing protein [Spirosoma sp.]
MPTLFRLFGYRFFYRMYDLINEPCHVHATDDANLLCKYWIREDDSFVLADTTKLKTAERKKIEKALTEHMSQIKETYEHHCQANGINHNYYRQTD